jgi:hypothetical protein
MLLINFFGIKLLLFFNELTFNRQITVFIWFMVHFGLLLNWGQLLVHSNA